MVVCKCVSVCVWERDKNMSVFCLPVFVCLQFIVWLALSASVCGFVYISSVMFTTGTAFLQPKFPVPSRAITPPICICVDVYVFVRVQVLSWSAPLFVPLCCFSLNSLFSYSSIVAKRILPPFTHPLPVSTLCLASTVLITHTPRCGPSVRAFEVILAQILLSYTADKTREGLRLRASRNVCMCVSFCLLNHQCLLFHLCLYSSDCVHKRKQKGRLSACVYAEGKRVKLSPCIPFSEIVSVYPKECIWSLVYGCTSIKASFLVTLVLD